LTASPNDLQPLYVVDTNALIWYLTGHPRLSKKAGAIFEAAGRGETRLIVSAISVAEMYYSDKKFGHFTDFEEVYRALKSRPEFEFVPFNPDDVLAFDGDAAIPGMHDRIIAGLARRLDAPLIASDPEMVGAKIVETVW